MSKIIRVFPHRAKHFTPTGEYVFIGEPPVLFIPPNDEVHISCVFTWDKAKCEELKSQWEFVTDKPVKLGGPAYDSPAEDFKQGMYLKSNIIFTTRGCNNNCPWCVVPKREGKLRELPVCQGNIIQDNNFLQASRAHKDKVFDMLRTQHGICFKGGLEPELIDDHFINAITSLRISELWLACDTDAALPGFKRAAEKLVRALKKPNQELRHVRAKIHCYALIGDDMDKNEARLREIYNAGAMPSAQLYRDFGDEKTKYSTRWNAFERQWQRPAATIKHMECGTDYRDYRTQTKGARIWR